MEIIDHRRNTIDQLVSTDARHGVEVDIRSNGESLVIHHDPMTAGELFLDWIDHYAHGTLILNVKEEGLEDYLLAIMKERNINDFFFLDQSFPFLLKTAKSGERRCAARVSEYESIDTALSLSGLIDWIWVDCFTKFPLTKEDAAKLRDAGFKLCLVSPELQGRHEDGEIVAMKSLLADENILFDAVCTKKPGIWEE